MLALTLLAIPFVSVFYIVMEGFSERRGARKGIEAAHSKVAVPKPAEETTKNSAEASDRLQLLNPRAAAIP